ncbi:putative 1,3-beta-glucan synthase [Rosa chinensis]|uniref:Putative 1,3-beta-glucan synthase n=1 Tax=Rosa chinensis TaxID=74649 RepID=A0A2P6S6W9_ROSCH|nr:putative 1,3-beta-glucan synthase [Rosa chinensis]
MFGFQKDNVACQRERLILLIASVHIWQLPKSDQQPKVANYSAGSTAAEITIHGFISSYMGRGCQLEIHAGMPLLHLSSYWRAYGMAFELYGMLTGSVSPITGEHIKPAYGGEEGAFSGKVVTPIYNTIPKEAERSKRGKSKHSQWRNYDDLNEYFW